MGWGIFLMSPSNKKNVSFLTAKEVSSADTSVQLWCQLREQS